jgi:thymidylate kinase
MYTIVLEGLPASGKTSVANLLKDRYGFYKVNESLGYLRKESITETQEEVFNETVQKYLRAKKSKQNTVIDRGYPSLLAWDYCAEKLGYSHNLEEKNKWVNNSLRKHELYEPDLYLYIQISPKTSLVRRPRFKNEDDVWSSLFGMESCLDFYKNFFSSDRKNVIFLDGSNSVENIEHKIRDIIHGL